MNNKIIRRGLAAAIVVLSSTGGALAVPSVGDVSIWDSTILPAPPAILPIGGSGQINGEFQIDTAQAGNLAIEIGLRAQERFIGPSLPRTGNMYFAQPGDSTPGAATWNYDIHLDFGTTFLGTKLGQALAPLNMRDFGVFFALDTDPTAAVNFVITDLNAALTGLGAGSPINLFQTSQNIGFGVFGGPLGTGPGIYDLALAVFAGSAEIVRTDIQVKVGAVDVPEPATLGLFGFGLAGLGFARRRKTA